ncbi:MAG: SpoIIE family protein phosphatase [Bacteroidota bacterium]
MGNQDVKELLDKIVYLEEKMDAQEDMLKMTSRHLKNNQKRLKKVNKHLGDSINSARRIQDSLMPSDNVLNAIFPGSFALHIPKDELSGDIFWVRHFGNTRYAAAIDCTGHGVPGAMLSVLAISLLNQIFASNIGQLSPAHILTELNMLLRQQTQSMENRTQIRDGMDVALIAYHPKERKLEFAGAKRPLYVLRDNKIIEVKGSRISLGEVRTRGKQVKIENHSLTTELGDWAYIFSDGYHDQFGGPNNYKMMRRRFRYLLAGNQRAYEGGNAQKQGLHDYFNDWKDGRTQTDDVLVMGIPL